MKSNICSLFLLLFCITSCATIKNNTNKHKLQIVKAGYQHWSITSGIGKTPERGTRLAVLVKNWPQNATAKTIIYRGRKSLTPAVTDTSDAGTIVAAEILTSSHVSKNKSEQTSLSDRLVYTLSNGEERFVEIEDWKQIDT